MERILVWGTGKISERIVERVSKDNNYIIVAFVDNNKDRVDNFFHETEVISPSRLDKYAFDLIVIACSFIDDIIRQISDEYPQYEDKTISYKELEKYLRVNRWNTEWGKYWFRKKVCFIGNEEVFNNYADVARYYFDDYLFLDETEINKYNLAKYDHIFICPPMYLSDEDRAKIQEELAQRIIHKSVLIFEDWNPIFENDIQCSFGTENDDKRFYVIKVSDAVSAWGNILPDFMRGVSYAKKMGYIPFIDMKNFRNQYLEKNNKSDNAWEYYYEQISSYSIDEVYNSKEVIISGIYSTMGFPMNYDVFKKNSDTERYISEYYHKLFPKHEKVLGVVYRGTDYYSAYNHPIPPDVCSYIDGIKRIMKKYDYNYVFLATEVLEIVEIFVKEFDDYVLFTDQRRYHANERRLLYTVHFDRENDRRLKGLEYLTVLELLAKCDAIIGPYNATVRMAELIKKDAFDFMISDRDLLNR